jgi:hypothetical protein
VSKKALYVSGSLGLGHIVRDLVIAQALHKEIPDLQISWLSPNPASILIEEAGETLLPESDLLANDNIPAEQAAKPGLTLSLQDYLLKAMGAWEQNVHTFEQVIRKRQFDLVIADEAYEISIAVGPSQQVQMEAKFVMLYDFVGNFPMTRNPLEWLGAYMWNREWAKMRDQFDGETQMALFLGEPEDVPEKGLGPFLPTAHDLAMQACEFVGYIVPFDPQKYADKDQVRAKLGYGTEPLVVCAVGGTAVGKDLLTLCGKAYLLIKQQVPDLHMVLVCGPRLAPEDIDVPRGVDVRGYVPALYEHLAASDLAVVLSGGTTTLELTALRRPFLYFPLRGHFEQQVHVAQRLARHQAGIRMSYHRTTPESLAEAIVANLGKEATYASIATDGARRAAQLIGRFL